MSTPVRSSGARLADGVPTARAMAPVVVTVMKTEPANRAPIGVPMTSVLSPFTGLTAARIAEAMASGICTRPVVSPATRSFLTSLRFGRLMGDFTCVDSRLVYGAFTRGNIWRGQGAQGSDVDVPSR